MYTCCAHLKVRCCRVRAATFSAAFADCSCSCCSHAMPAAAGTAAYAADSLRTCLHLNLYACTLPALVCIADTVSVQESECEYTCARFHSRCLASLSHCLLLIEAGTSFFCFSLLQSSSAEALSYLQTGSLSPLISLPSLLLRPFLSFTDRLPA